MPKKNGATKFYIIIFLIISFALCVSMADLMSNFITVGSFNFTYHGIKHNDFDIYAISLAKAISPTQAKELSDTYKNQNAAGYIWTYDGQCFIFASAYENENDAVKVQTKLKEQNIETSIVKLEFDSIDISGDFDQKEKVVLLSSLACFKTTYSSLYDISVSLDTQTKNEIESLISVGDIKSNVTKIKSEFDSHFNSKITNSLLAIKLKLDTIIKKLDNLINDEKNNNTYLSSNIKYCYFEILKLYYDLGEEI